MFKQKIGSRIYLSESSVKNFYECFHKSFENFVFFRWIYFKNRPRSTFLLLRSILITLLFGSLYYTFVSRFKFIIMGVDVDPILVFGFIGTLGYWNMLKSFYEKNNYASQLYNEVIKEKARKHLQSSKILAVNLSIQLLSMDLWSHRIYSLKFTECLYEAFQHSFSEDATYKSPYNTLEELISITKEKKLKVCEARNLLLSYQYYLEGQIS